MEGMNRLQRAIAQEYLDGVQRDSSPEAKKALKKRIGKKYDVSLFMIDGLLRLAAVEGLTRKSSNPKRYKRGYAYVPVNYNQLVADLTKRIERLEYEFKEILQQQQGVFEGISETAVHLHQLSLARYRVLGREAEEPPKLPFFEIKGT